MKQNSHIDHDWTTQLTTIGSAPANVKLVTILPEYSPTAPPPPPCYYYLADQSHHHCNCWCHFPPENSQVIKGHNVCTN